MVHTRVIHAPVVHTRVIHAPVFHIPVVHTFMVHARVIRTHVSHMYTVGRVICCPVHHHVARVIMRHLCEQGYVTLCDRGRSQVKRRRWNEAVFLARSTSRLLFSFPAA